MSQHCSGVELSCVLLLANDVRAEPAFPHFVLGEAGVPWSWEYGDRAFWDGR